MMTLLLLLVMDCQVGRPERNGEENRKYDLKNSVFSKRGNSKNNITRTCLETSVPALPTDATSGSNFMKLRVVMAGHQYRDDDVITNLSMLHDLTSQQRGYLDALTASRVKCET